MRAKNKEIIRSYIERHGDTFVCGDPVEEDNVQLKRDGPRMSVRCKSCHRAQSARTMALVRLAIGCAVRQSTLTKYSISNREAAQAKRRGQR